MCTVKENRYADSVRFQPSKGSGRPGDVAGTVDYRLDRRRVLRALRSGDIDRGEACDAQIELLRVGRSASVEAPSPCPVCDESSLRHVRFVFGPRLPAAGRAITSAKELDRLAQRPGPFRCFLVEVCIGCRWNHLLSSYLLAPKKSA